MILSFTAILFGCCSCREFITNFMGHCICITLSFLCIMYYKNLPSLILIKPIDVGESTVIRSTFLFISLSIFGCLQYCFSTLPYKMSLSLLGNYACFRYYKAITSLICTCDFPFKWLTMFFLMKKILGGLCDHSSLW